MLVAKIAPDLLFVDAESALISYMESMVDYNFQFNFSGGKDSSAIVGLVLSLLKQGKLSESIRKRIVIYHSDTTIEPPLFTAFTRKVLAYFSEQGLKVIIGTAEINKRFFSQLFGYGKPVPNHAVRWCTDNLKIKVAESVAKSLGTKTVIFTGEHVGESHNRDIKLAKISSCGSNECGSDSFKSKTKKKNEQLVHRPIQSWVTCQVWEYLWYLDYSLVFYKGFYNEISTIYKISKDTDTNKSLRMGCVGCPVIAIKNHYETADKGIPNHLSIKLALIFEEMRDDNLRLRNPKRFGDGTERNGAFGALAIESRRYYWDEVLKINEEFRNIGFDMISDEEIAFVNESLAIRQYPVTYHRNSNKLLQLETEWQTRRPSWIES